MLKEVKMRQDSLVEFEKAERSELAEQAKAEIEILKNICLNRLAMKNCVLWLLKLSPRDWCRRTESDW